MLEHFAPEYVGPFYRSQYPDLADHSDEDLLQHYMTYGRSEGRAASPTALRKGLTSVFAEAGKALEIGPFYRPMLSGPGAHFFDVLNQEALRKRAANVNGDPEGVPFINYVSPIGDITVIQDKFDLVASSHCIEHQPDLVRHLQNVENLLVDDGVYALIIPDCRYCFDHFLPPSHLGDVLEAYFESRKVHRLSDVIEHRAFTSHNEAALHWLGDHGTKPGSVDAIRKAVAEWQNANGGYVDVHAWQFTPDTFAAIINGLHEMGMIGLHIGRCYHSGAGTNEFCAVLTR